MFGLTLAQKGFDTNQMIRRSVEPTELAGEERHVPGFCWQSAINH